MAKRPHEARLVLETRLAYSEGNLRPLPGEPRKRLIIGSREIAITLSQDEAMISRFNCIQCLPFCAARNLLIRPGSDAESIPI